MESSPRLAVSDSLSSPARCPMLSSHLRFFSDELVKIAAISPAQAMELVGAHHGAEDKNWKAFEKNLRLKGFRNAVVLHPESDAKLKRYTKTVGDYMGSKEVVGVVPSRTRSKLYKIKELSNGRLGCSCKDWKYSHSHKKTDCEHIKELKQGLST